MALSFLHLITGLLNELRRCSTLRCVAFQRYVRTGDGRTDRHTPGHSYSTALA